MIFELTLLDIILPLITLLAVIIAAIKDALVKQLSPMDPFSDEDLMPVEKYILDLKKITPLNIAAVCLAVIGFWVTLYSINNAKISAKNANTQLEKLKKDTEEIKDTDQITLKQIGILVMDKPIALEERSAPKKLPGELADLSIKVKNVSNHKPFAISVLSKNMEPVEITCDNGNLEDRVTGNDCMINPLISKRNNTIPSIWLKHNGHQYKIELTVESNIASFGQGNDYLICRILER